MAPGPHFGNQWIRLWASQHLDFVGFCTHYRENTISPKYLKMSVPPLTRLPHLDIVSRISLYLIKSILKIVLIYLLQTATYKLGILWSHSQTKNVHTLLLPISPIFQHLSFISIQHIPPKIFFFFSNNFMTYPTSSVSYLLPPTLVSCLRSDCRLQTCFPHVVSLCWGNSARQPRSSRSMGLGGWLAPPLPNSPPPSFFSAPTHSPLLSGLRCLTTMKLCLAARIRQR